MFKAEFLSIFVFAMFLAGIKIVYMLNLPWFVFIAATAVFGVLVMVRSGTGKKAPAE